MLTLFADRLGPFRRTATTTGGLVGASVVTSTTGFVFWWIAARAYPESAVGLAGAAVSAMLLLSQISVLGLGTTLVGVLHSESRPASLILTALITATAAASVLGIAFALLAPILSTELAAIGSTPVALLVFAAGVSFSALASVIDQVLIARAHNLLQFLRNAIFAFVRLGILVIAVLSLTREGMAIYAVWLGSILVSLVVLFPLLRRRRTAASLMPLAWGRLRELATGSLAHHILTLSRSSAVWLLPVLVTIMLSREANASFYVALLLANFIALVTVSATFTLYVGGAQAPEQLWRQVRFTLILTVLTAVGGTILLALAGQPLLGIFGGTYAESAYPAVVYLALGTIPLVVKDHWIAVQRIHGGVGRAAVIGVVALAAELGASAIGAGLGGIEGLAIARLAILVVEAALMWPDVGRAIQRPVTLTPEGDAA